MYKQMHYIHGNKMWRQANESLASASEGFTFGIDIAQTDRVDMAIRKLASTALIPFGGCGGGFVASQ
jgi:hypothetical protein